MKPLILTFIRITILFIMNFNRHIANKPFSSLKGYKIVGCGNPGFPLGSLGNFIVTRHDCNHCLYEDFYKAVLISR